MRYKSFIVVLVGLLIFTSCKKENRCDCFKSTGPIKTESRDIKEFNTIILSDKIDLYITQGSFFEVKVEAGANLQGLIKTELDGETLKVVNNNKCNWVRGYKHKIKVYVTAPYFKYLEHDGLGTFESTNTITQDSICLRAGGSGDFKLDVNISRVYGSANGNGNLYISGSTNRLNWDYRGTNFLYAENLIITNYVYLHSESLGRAYINAPHNGLMDVIIDTSGDVYYKGNPSTIRLTKNSKGSLIRD